MIEDAIRLIAAAICSEKKKTELYITPDPALQPVVDLLMLLSAYADISVTGRTLVDPIIRLPVDLPLRFNSMTKDVFLLFAGFFAKINVVLKVETVEGGVTREELQTLSDAMDGVLAFAKKGDGVMLSAFSNGSDRLNPNVAVSPIFAAGAVLGAVLGYGSTAFTLGQNRNAPEVLCAIEAVNAFGGSAEETEDGAVKVQSIRNLRFHKKTGKRLRKRVKPCD